jgi:triacylglycerol esterase/lipase EstA (alpha/beta hydrolase family)
MRPLVLAVLALCACSPYRNVCSELRDKLQTCGFAVGELDCTRVVFSDVENLTQRLEERGCDGAATDDQDAVDKRLCVLGGWDCPRSPIPPFAEATPRFPIVLVSGIDGTAIFDWNPRIAGLHVKVLPWATTQERSEDLWQSLESLRAHLGGTRLNLVCYAVGGLDCRYVASPNGLFKGDSAGHARVVATIASITTIATPHRGTRVAEAAITALQSGTAQDFLQGLIGSSLATEIPDDAALMRTLQGLTLESLEAFNRQINDEPAIAYQSWAGVSHVLGRSSPKSDDLVRAHCAGPDGASLYLRHPDTNDEMSELLLATAPFSTLTHGDDGRVVTSPSDGMISVASARWGRFRGCLPADHYDLVGQVAHSTRDPRTGFDAPLFYRYVAADLAGSGL